MIEPTTRSPDPAEHAQHSHGSSAPPVILMEHAESRSDLIRAIPRTSIRLLQPHAFWSQPDRPFKLRQIVIGGALLILTLNMLAICVNQTAIYPRGLFASKETLFHFVTTFGQLLIAPRLSHASTEFALRPPGHSLVSHGTLLAWLTVWPICIFLLQFASSELRVNHRHLVRASLYSLCPFALFSLLIFIRAIVDPLQITINELAPTSKFWRLLPYEAAAILNDLIETAPILAMFWSALWWYAALKHGWQLKRARLIFAITLLAAAFSPLLLTVFSKPPQPPVPTLLFDR